MFVFREYDPYALCLVVGPGLEPFVWYATTAKAKVAYWDKQHMLFTTPSDFDRPEGGLGHRERRYMTRLFFGSHAATQRPDEQPQSDELWEQCRKNIPIYAPNSSLHETVPDQWGRKQDSSASGLADPNAPGLVLRYARKMRRKGYYVDAKAAATFTGPAQAEEILRVLVLNYGDGRLLTDEEVFETVRYLHREGWKHGSPFRTKQNPEIVYRYYRPRYFAHGALRVHGEPVLTPEQELEPTIAKEEHETNVSSND